MFDPCFGQHLSYLEQTNSEVTVSSRLVFLFADTYNLLLGHAAKNVTTSLNRNKGALSHNSDLCSNLGNEKP